MGLLWILSFLHSTFFGDEVRAARGAQECGAGGGRLDPAVGLRSQAANLSCMLSRAASALALGGGWMDGCMHA